ncbi:MAG: hypothetical protein K9J13_12685 [Saprospiraceae bacterium]|nr:hypothetical protein [Saprospiraceae bacterium]
MTIYHYILLVASLICFVASLRQLILALDKKGDSDYAEPKGTANPAISYSFTKAMSPTKKETAFLHLPTYSAGILFHIGTFLSIFLLAVHFVGINIPEALSYTIVAILAVSIISIVSIFIKRIVNSKSRAMSNADDYFSNFLIIGFQVISCLVLVMDNLLPLLFIYSSVMLLYIPLGKLKHTVYFFAARIQLGRFYGFRGVWPAAKKNN